MDVLGGIPLIHVVLSLFDAPLLNSGAGTQFNAGILGVDAIDSNGDSWQLTGSSTPQVVNLLALQSTSMDLGSGDLPAGTYPQLQFLLDPSTTTVVQNGQTYPVQILDPNHPWWDPTDSIEAVTVPFNISSSTAESVTASLDFNVFQSANLVNGIVYLTPTVAAGLGDPAILGTVVNNAGAPVANATIVATDANGNVANTSVTAADGTFRVHGISPGGYTISVLNSYTTAAGAAVTASGNDAGASPSTYIVVGPSSQVNTGSLTD
ncbi:MAG TPA: carboxypeptidase regulatory-like domain-containing protein [Candidatus Baltobacteraceae bacterium]|nr:carboxypeptidase regulatory-like domain-containing protein [Candidatus Baltobacteraceae bacterium]